MPMLKKYSDNNIADIRIFIVEHKEQKDRKPFIFWRIIKNVLEITKAYCKYIDDEDAPFNINAYEYAGAFLETSDADYNVPWMYDLGIVPNAVIKKIEKVQILTPLTLPGPFTFAGFESLADIVNANYITIGTDITSMFYGCSSLKNIDCSSILTTNITEMGKAFKKCESLEHIYINPKKWYTDDHFISDVTIFDHDTSLPNVDGVSETNSGAYFYIKDDNDNIKYGCFEPKLFYKISNRSFTILRNALGGNSFYYFLDYDASTENPDIVVVHPVVNSTLYLTTKNDDIPIEDLLL